MNHTLHLASALARTFAREETNMTRITGLALALLMLLGFAVPAAAGENSNHDRGSSTLYATGQAGTVLLAIDLKEGTTAVIGPTGQPGSLALAITPDGRAAYTVAKFKSPQAQLAKIDLATGAATLVGNPLGGNLQVMGLTFAPDGVLYAAGDFTFGPPVSPTLSPTFNSLYTIDLNSGSATRVGSFGVGSKPTDFIMSFAFDSDGSMYGASMMALYRIHLPLTTDGEGGEARTLEAGQGAQPLATKVVDFVESPIRSSAVMGIAIGEDGSFYAADFRPTSTIYAVDTETGLLKPLFTSTTAFVHNIAFKPNASEIATEIATMRMTNPTPGDTWAAGG
jgi:hypothetical protein